METSPRVNDLSLFEMLAWLELIPTGLSEERAASESYFQVEYLRFLFLFFVFMQLVSVMK